MLKIIKDTREKIGAWEFVDAELINKKLDTGDYSIDGMTDSVCIERKKSVSEIAINLGQDFVRFEKELKRMKSFKFAYIICEFTLEDVLMFPKGTNIKSSLLSSVKISGRFLAKQLNSLKDKYGVEVIFAGDRNNAIIEAEKIFNIIMELNNE